MIGKSPMEKTRRRELDSETEESSKRKTKAGQILIEFHLKITNKSSLGGDQEATGEKGSGL